MQNLLVCTTDTKWDKLISWPRASLCICVCLLPPHSQSGAELSCQRWETKLLISVADYQQVSDTAGHNKLTHAHAHTQRRTYLLSLWLCFLCLCLCVACVSGGQNTGGVSSRWTEKRWNLPLIRVSRSAEVNQFFFFLLKDFKLLCPCHFLQSH